MPTSWTIDDAAHLLRRTGFGAAPLLTRRATRAGFDTSLRWALRVPPNACALPTDDADPVGPWLAQLVRTRRPLGEKLAWIGLRELLGEDAVRPSDPAAWSLALDALRSITLRPRASGSLARFGALLGGSGPLRTAPDAARASVARGSPGVPVPAAAPDTGLSAPSPPPATLECERRALACLLAGLGAPWLIEAPRLAALAAAVDGGDRSLLHGVRAILCLPCFWDPTLRGSRTRDPLSWLVGALRCLGHRARELPPATLAGWLGTLTNRDPSPAAWCGATGTRERLGVADRILAATGAPRAWTRARIAEERADQLLTQLDVVRPATATRSAVLHVLGTARDSPDDDADRDWEQLVAVVLASPDALAC